MKFSNLIIFELVGGCEFRYLLIKKSNISLILIAQNLFLICIFVEYLLQIVNFAATWLSSRVQLLLAFANCSLSIFNYIC